ncbi:hypothetical protein ACGFX8_16350, partial [Streptomyces sp. NPDC048362]|uniref:hypothetical protein n=1 Tax=Streptomyces sp. NPDC048362 TaxID=3365539 RepID=UPI00371A7E94
DPSLPEETSGCAVTSWPPAARSARRRPRATRKGSERHAHACTVRSPRQALAPEQRRRRWGDGLL